MWKQFRNWWKARGDLVHLEALDDRLLADMGLEHEGLRRRVLGLDPAPSLPQTHPAPAIPRAPKGAAKAGRSAC